jgi:hypothetical protein
MDIKAARLVQPSRQQHKNHHNHTESCNTQVTGNRQCTLPHLRSKPEWTQGLPSMLIKNNARMPDCMQQKATRSSRMQHSVLFTARRVQALCATELDSHPVQHPQQASWVLHLAGLQASDECTCPQRATTLSARAYGTKYACRHAALYGAANTAVLGTLG